MRSNQHSAAIPATSDQLPSGNPPSWTAVVRSGLRSAARSAVRLLGLSFTNGWRPYSRLFLVSDSASWSLSWDLLELAAISKRLGIGVHGPTLSYLSAHQCAFYGSQFVLLEDRWLTRGHRVGLAYFHGRPGSGYPEFDAIYDRMKRLHDRIHRVQVPNREMQTLLLDTGISAEKLFLIPIGINLGYFPMRTAQSRASARTKLGIPESAKVIGSFQKDGTGWGEGLEPKLIKGPDVFLKTIGLMKSKEKDLYVLLSGPARGYVKRGLEELGVPYRHLFVRHYPDIATLYRALDLYLVTSRQEGGPKAVLESMACGVPLVTTRVGQAADMVCHGENGWMAEVEDVEALAHWSVHALASQTSLGPVLAKARQTAEANSYDAQLPLWRDFMAGFVETGQNGHLASVPGVAR